MKHTDMFIFTAWHWVVLYRYVRGTNQPIHLVHSAVSEDTAYFRDWGECGEIVDELRTWSL